MEIPKSNNTVRLIAISFITVALFAIIFGVSWKYLSKKIIVSNQADYVIPGVPYIGIYNHKDSLSYTAYDIDCGIDSILEYWNQGKNDFEEIRKSFDYTNPDARYDEQINNLFNLKKDYKVEITSLDFEDLGDYINPKARTPLLVWIPVDKDQPKQVLYHPIQVLIGIKWSEKKLVFHNYWLGNNYEMTFDEYNSIWQAVQPEGRNLYIIIKPTNLEEKLKELNNKRPEAYPSRTQIMNEAEGMFNNYALGAGAYLSGQWEIALSYFSKIESDQKYAEWFPPEFKTRLLYEIGNIYLRKGDYNKALSYLNKSAEIDYDLNKPFKDWPGYELRTNKPDVIDRLPHPYIFLGDLYYAQRNFNKAKENYQKALDIKPQEQSALKGLRLSEVGLLSSVK
jgi:tetratricopeptide (TPR) repeat protein